MPSSIMLPEWHVFQYTPGFINTPQHLFTTVPTAAHNEDCILPCSSSHS